MKTTCPKCGARYTVPSQDILRHIESDKNIQPKIASLLGRLTGGQTRLSAEARRIRALKAVRAREAKRKKASDA